MAYINNFTLPQPTLFPTPTLHRKNHTQTAPHLVLHRSSAFLTSHLAHLSLYSSSSLLISSSTSHLASKAASYSTSHHHQHNQQQQQQQQTPTYIHTPSRSTSTSTSNSNPSFSAWSIVRAASSPNDPQQSANDHIDSDSARLELEFQTGLTRAPRPTRYGKRSAGKALIRRQGSKYGGKHGRIDLTPKLRVAGGSARGRRLESPDIYLRPMMGKVREALFSMLYHMGAIKDDGKVLDVFAGSGSIGIEAISRGMHSAVFVDASPESIKAVEKNLDAFGFTEQGRAICARAEEVINSPEQFGITEHFDLITLTPPYEEVDYGVLLSSVAKSKLIGEGSIVVVEYPYELKTLPGTIGHRLIGIRNRKYGRTILGVYGCQLDPNIDLRPEEFIQPK